ncbi:MAG: hypothetical protein H8D87_21945 [Deltaproteobacteria bacterium]|uniref:hypothetical protein n=1 Tax=Desulfobacula sp. TaxID=2593537 RepID=UPI0019A7CD48|nr:hypothetical protein [Candidatus Desulfobacula maris]MBL6993507.1 hypothetical protein [Desulfobacula sp.]
MIFCKHRDCLSREERLRRSYYEVLRDELDQFVLRYSLVESYNNFLRLRMPYPFVELRELKPRARIPSVEFSAQNSFLIIFSEDFIDKKHKKYIRYFDVNKTTKDNLLKHKYFPDVENFNRDLKFFETGEFFSLLGSLLPIDYALLIQRNQRTKVRYALTHFHVRIDWPIAEASEDLARDLRYISKDLYEKGDKYAEDFQKKLFEYYGVPVMSGGRRTAAIVAAQYFRQLPGITTIYVSSSESRNLLRIDERGVCKSVLVKLPDSEIKKLASSAGITQNSFTKNYVIARQRKNFICILNVKYDYTSHALPSEGGRLRELNPDTNWLTVSQEHILPKPSTLIHPPIPYKMVYL